MIKKFAALLLTLCIMLCMSACDLELSSSNPESSSSQIETSLEAELDVDDIFYDEDEAETSSEVIFEIQDIQTTTTSKAPVLDEVSTSSKISISTSSKTSTSSKKVTTSKVTVPVNDEANEYFVWIPTNGGKKYHTKSSCSNMKNPEQVSEKTAKSRGFDPCKRCH